MATMYYRGVRPEYEVIPAKNRIVNVIGSRASHNNKNRTVNMCEVIDVEIIECTVPMNKSVINKLSKLNFIGDE